MKKEIFQIVLHCWDPNQNGGFYEYNDMVTTVFVSYDEAVKEAYRCALDELESLNDEHYSSIEEAEALQETKDFRLDIDGEDLCIIRKWDGDDYWPVTTYNIVKLILKEV